MTSAIEAAFWILWCPNAPTPPTVRHSSLDKALIEAERMAHTNPGYEFFVMQATESRFVMKMGSRTFTAPDEVPF